MASNRVMARQDGARREKTGDDKTASAPSYSTLQIFFTFGMRTLARLDSSPVSPHPPSRHRGCNCKSNWVLDPDKLCSLTWDPTAIEDGSPRPRGGSGHSRPARDPTLLDRSLLIFKLFSLLFTCHAAVVAVSFKTMQHHLPFSGSKPFPKP